MPAHFPPETQGLIAALTYLSSHRHQHNEPTPSPSRRISTVIITLQQSQSGSNRSIQTYCSKTTTTAIAPQNSLFRHRCRLHSLRDCLGPLMIDGALISLPPTLLLRATTTPGRAVTSCPARACGASSTHHITHLCDVSPTLHNRRAARPTELTSCNKAR